MSFQVLGVTLDFVLLAVHPNFGSHIFLSYFTNLNAFTKNLLIKMVHQSLQWNNSHKSSTSVIKFNFFPKKVLFLFTYFSKENMQI